MLFERLMLTKVNSCLSEAYVEPFLPNKKYTITPVTGSSRTLCDALPACTEYFSAERREIAIALTFHPWESCAVTSSSRSSNMQRSPVHFSD